VPGPVTATSTAKAASSSACGGEDAAFDHSKLTRDLFGRRVNLATPEESLILLKATGKVPHEGGVRFDAASREYGILKSWIAAGCPDDGDKSPKPISLDVGEAKPRADGSGGSHHDHCQSEVQ